MATLDGTLAFPKRDDATMCIGENLDFDVMGPVEIFFEVKAIVAESVHGFRRSVAEGGLEFGGAVDKAHALATATGDSFEKNGVAHTLREGLRFRETLDGVVRPGNRGNIGAAGKLASGGFGTERFHGVGWRADGGDADIGGGARQGGGFREETINRVDGEIGK